MRVYEVQPGDSPARIAARDDMAGCPRCARDLVAANAHFKPTVTHPNGFVSFKELKVGEKLILPEKWFDGTLDRMPKSYFSSLPHPDGVTPSKNGLGDQSILDSAIATATTLATMSDQSFSNAANASATIIDQSVSEADGSANPGIAAYAQAVHLATNAARQRNSDLVAALNAGDQAKASAARVDVQNDLLTAIDAARLALQAVYGGAAPSSPGIDVTIGPATITPSNITAIAQAAAAAIAADPSFCESIAHPGSAVNSAVHAFKTAWNTANPNNPVPINTSTYEQATADVLTRVLGSAPPACVGRTSASPTQTGITPPQQDSGLSVGAILGLGLLGAGVVGGAVYFVTRDKPKVRRVFPSGGPVRRRQRDDTIGPWSPT